MAKGHPSELSPGRKPGPFLASSHEEELADGGAQWRSGQGSTAPWRHYHGLQLVDCREIEGR